MTRQINIYKITGDQLTGSELEFNVKRMQPVIGSKLSAHDYFRYIVKTYNADNVLLTPSEIGCTLSHLKIYKEIIDADLAAIIFEADMMLETRDLKKAVSACSIAEKDFIHLGWHPNVYKDIYFQGREISRCGEIPLIEINPRKCFFGAYAYFITPKVAKSLLDFHSKRIRKADAWNIYFPNSGLQPYFLGIFSHPVNRAEIEAERTKVQQMRVTSVVKRKLVTFVTVCLNRLKGALSGYRDITPTVFDKVPLNDK